jgi:LMBR1 domain-containing protein 1
MLCSIPTVQFCVQAFPVYARYTDVDMLFGTQIRYLPVFDWFWDNNVFVIALCALSGLTFLYMMAFPNDKGKNVEKQLAAFSKEYDSEHNGKKKYKK